MPGEATIGVGAPRLRVVRRDEVPPEVARARAERTARRDLMTLSASVTALTILGLVMVLSASAVSAFTEYGSSFHFFQRQLIYAVIGAGAAAVAARMSYRVWQRWWVPLVVVSLVLLGMVLHPRFGTEAGGAARWISLGWFSVQPSEVAKFALVAATASIISRHFRHLDDAVRWMVTLVPLLCVVCALILLQPDLGTTVIIAGTVFLMLFVAGVRFRVLAIGLLLGGGAGALSIMTEAYRRTRFLSFLNPWADPQNTGYQIIQSLIALGSGHVLGVGLGAGRQKWMYVPNAHTDFIFSIMGEELGLLGELGVLSMFGAIVYTGIRIAMRAPDTFGRLLAAGITGWIGLQALVNLGAVTGVLPITGVPLPFMSFGGSSLLVSLFAVGVLLSVGRASIRASQAPASARRRSGQGSEPAAPRSTRGGGG